MPNLETWEIIEEIRENMEALFCYPQVFVKIFELFQENISRLLLYQQLWPKNILFIADEFYIRNDGQLT